VDSREIYLSYRRNENTMKAIRREMAISQPKMNMKILWDEVNSATFEEKAENK